MEINELDGRLSYLKKYGRNSLSYLTLSDDLSFFKNNWNGYVAYKEFFNSIVVLGDPIVSSYSLPIVIKDIKENLISKNVNICFFLCTNKIIKYLKEAGFKGFFVGDEAIVDLNKFDISGKKGRSIRSSVNYAKKNDMIVEEYNYKNEKSLEIEIKIEKISKEWCDTRKLPEFKFAFGQVNFDKSNETRYFICKYKERIVGFINYYPIYGINSYYLDLTRKGINAPRGVIDFLYVSSFNILKEEGINKIYIGYSPVSSFSTINPQFTTNISDLLRKIFTLFYPAKSEFFFKKKYATEWMPNYFFYYPRLSIRMLFSLLHSICEGGLGAIFLNNIKKFF